MGAALAAKKVSQTQLRRLLDTAEAAAAVEEDEDLLAALADEDDDDIAAHGDGKRAAAGGGRKRALVAAKAGLVPADVLLEQGMRYAFYANASLPVVAGGDIVALAVAIGKQSKATGAPLAARLLEEVYIAASSILTLFAEAGLDEVEERFRAAHLGLIASIAVAAKGDTNYHVSLLNAVQEAYVNAYRLYGREHPAVAGTLV